MSIQTISFGSSSNIEENLQQKMTSTSGTSHIQQRSNLLANDTLVLSTNNHSDLIFSNADLDFPVNFTQVADFSNDGSLEIVCASPKDNTTLFINATDFSTLFSNKDSITGISALLVDNFSSDAGPEVVVGSENKVLFMNGTGVSLYSFTNFTGKVIALAAGDFNNDDQLDVAVAVNDTVFFINGQTGSQIRNNSAASGVITAMLVLKDLSGDSVLDCVVGTTGPTEILVINGATGATLFTNAAPTGPISSLAITLANGDGIYDIVAGSDDTNVYFIDGSSHNVLYTNSDPLGKVSVIKALDFNNDLKDEIFAGSFDKKVYQINRTTGSTIRIFTIAKDWVVSLAFADFNDDLALDIAIGSDESNVYYIDGKTYQSFYVFEEPTRGLWSLQVADINQDGVTDLVAGSEDGSVYLQLSDTEAPILKTITLPEIATSQESLIFHAIYNEPSIDSLTMSYFGQTKVYTVDATFEEDGSTTFVIPASSNNPFKYWFTTNDTWGNLAKYGNQTTPYELNINLQTTFRTHIAKNFIQSLALGDFDNDTESEIVVGSEDSDVYFLDQNGSLMYTNTLPSEGIYHLVTAQLTSDMIPDVVVASKDGRIYAINGSNGQTLFVNSNATDMIYRIAIADFTKDGVPDIAATSADSNIYFLNGTNGQLLYVNTSPEQWAGPILATDIFGHTLDFNNDTYPDVVVGSDDSDIYFIDGHTGTTIRENTDPDGLVNELICADFNGDLFPDVAAVSDDNNVYFINGQTGITMYINEDPTDWVQSMVAGDFNNDTCTDIVVGSVDNTLYVINGRTGTTMYKILIQDLISVWALIPMAVADLNYDGHPDLVATRAGWKGIYTIDGQTWKVTEIISLSQPVAQRCNILLTDLDGNGILDIISGAENGDVNVEQPLKQYSTLYPEMIISPQVNQGKQLTINLSIYDYYDHLKTIEWLNIIAKKDNSTLKKILPFTAMANNQYQFTFTTEDWLVGRWYLYPVLENEPFNPIDESDYIDRNGKYIPLYSLDVIGNTTVIESFYAKGAGYQPIAKTLNKVIEGTNISIEFTVQDEYYHILSSDDAQVTVSFNGHNYTAEFRSIGKKFVQDLYTTGLHFGSYSARVYIAGPYLLPHIYDFIINIIPRFPELSLRQDQLLLISGVALVISLILTKMMKSVYKNVINEPEVFHNRTKMMIRFIGIMFLFTLAISIYAYNFSPVLTFLALLLTFGEIILLYFFWFFRLIYARMFTLTFGWRTWWPSIFYIGAIGLLMLFNFAACTQIEWLDYCLSQRKTTILFWPNIPTLFWDIGVVGFATGFVLVIITGIWEVKNNIEELNETKDKVSKGYYPKEPEKMKQETVSKAQSSFSSLFRSFVIWYAIIIVSFFTAFELGAYLPILIACVIPFGIALLIFFREPLLGIITTIIPISVPLIQQKENR